MLAILYQTKVKDLALGPMSLANAEVTLGSQIWPGIEKYRVDVSEEFPFLVTKMSLYYDR